MSYYRLDLLRHSWHRGPSSFFHLCWALLLDRYVRRRHLVFALASDALETPRINVAGMAIADCRGWDELPMTTAAQVRAEHKQFWWDSDAWFRRGWRMWYGLLDGRVACVSWSRTGDQSDDFFCPLTTSDALIWETVTLPAFRGRGLYPALLQHIGHTLLRAGAARVFISCRDYNAPSRHGIERAGFRFVGCAIERRHGQRAWRPAVSPVPSASQGELSERHA